MLAKLDSLAGESSSWYQMLSSTEKTMILEVIPALKSLAALPERLCEILDDCLEGVGYSVLSSTIKELRA